MFIRERFGLIRARYRDGSFGDRGRSRFRWVIAGIARISREPIRSLLREPFEQWLPADRITFRSGWRDAGKQGTKADCLAYIEQVWTDMRPRSVRERTG